MIPEAPFLFSIAALSATMAGLAGLVAALRRGSEMRAVDLFRLQQIVEFCFANIVIALSVVPLASLLGGSGPAVQVMAAVAVTYQVFSIVVLRRRQRQYHLAWSATWYVGASVLNIMIFVAGVAALLTGGMAAFEVLLVLFLARPMFVFLLVLQSFERD
ncbi:MAG TPA: hypothetical protein VIF84_09775 [Candidatus Limnocylindrales bacterium]